MSNYTFEEISSRNGTKNGESVRMVSFRGTEPRETREDNEYLNITGSVSMPVMDYFTAGTEGKLPNVIKEKVIEQLTAREEKPEEEPPENAE